MWRTLNVYYHQNDKTHLILNGVEPIIEELRKKKLLKGFYFTRHWMKGPHVRMNFLCSEEGLFEEKIRPLVVTKLNDYLEKFPSKEIKEEEFRRLYEELSLLEMEEEPAFPFITNNTIHDAEYQNHFLLTDRSIQFLEEYYVATNDMIMNILKRMDNNPKELITDLIGIMVLTIAHVKDIRRSYLSFRSHSESMLNLYDKSGIVRSKFDEQYLLNRELIIRTISEIMKLLNTGHSLTNDLFTNWGNFVSGYLRELKPVIHAGEVRLPSNDEMSPFYRERGLPQKWMQNEYSQFHKTLYSRKNIGEMFHDPVFHTLRFMLNNLYITFAQIGVKPIERFYLAYVVANAIEEIYQIDWKEQVLISE